MRQLLFLFLYVVSVNIVFSQCDEYYINELISGVDDKCYFPEGSPVRFCPRLKGIAINGTTFDVMQWDGISTQYLTLTKNGGIAGTIVLKLKEKELLVNLNGCGGARTYSISLNKAEFSQWRDIRRKTILDQTQRNNLLIKSQIDAELTSNNIIKAINIYNSWSTPDLDYKFKIQNAINNDTSTIQLFTTNQVSIIVNHFSSFFTNQTPGAYKLYGGKDGNISIKSPTDNVVFVGNTQNYMTDKYFTLPYTFEGELLISESRTKVNKDSTRFVISEKFKRKDIYVSKKGDYYLGGFGAPFSSEILNAPQFWSENVNDTIIEQQALMITEKRVNDIIVDSKTSWQLEKNITVKKGTGRKVLLIITSPIWGPFYIFALMSSY